MALLIKKGIGNLPRRLKLISLVCVLTLATGALLSKTLSIKPTQTPSTKTTTTNLSKTAKLVTCPRCRLNALPLVKKFVYDHAKHFEPALKVNFILGEDPVLHLYDNGKEVSEIDLAPLDWKQIIRKLDDFGIHPATQTDEIRAALSN